MLSAKDIIQIIKQCNKLGVNYIKIDNVEIKFSSETKETTPVLTNTPKDIKKMEEVAKEVEEEEKTEAEIDRLSSLDIENFEEYEDRILAGEFNQEGNY